MTLQSLACQRIRLPLPLSSWTDMHGLLGFWNLGRKLSSCVLLTNPSGLRCLDGQVAIKVDYVFSGSGQGQKNLQIFCGLLATRIRVFVGIPAGSLLAVGSGLLLKTEGQPLGVLAHCLPKPDIVKGTGLFS